MLVYIQRALVLLSLALASLSYANDLPETEVRIQQTEEQQLEEYKINGQIYAIKVTPKIGRPYFLVNAKGDGHFIRQERDVLLVPQWVLFEW